MKLYDFGNYESIYDGGGQQEKYNIDNIKEKNNIEEKSKSLKNLLKTFTNRLRKVLA